MSLLKNFSNFVPPRDPRTQSWFLVGNVYFLAAVIIGYIYIVKKVGPEFMKNRKPYDNLIPLIRVYNIVEVFLNVYYIAKVLPRTYFGGGYSFFCQPMDFKTTKEQDYEVLGMCWFYIWVRILDLMDTVFFVLRKKTEHVSFLHVAHHCIVVFLGWYGLAFGGDGNGLFLVLVNSFVHVIMYTYYFLASWGPVMRPYLFWKRYLTQLQIAQFIAVFAHGIIPLLYNCGYPRIHAVIFQSMIFFFLVLFLNFYSKTYKSSTLSTKQEKLLRNGFKAEHQILKDVAKVQ